MKLHFKWLVLLFFINVTCVFAQYQYNIQLDVNDKQSLTLITENLDAVNRYVLDNKITFESSQSLALSFLDSIANYRGYQIIDYQRINLTIDPTYSITPKACCNLTGNIAEADGDKALNFFINNVRTEVFAGSASAESFTIPYCDGDELFIQYSGGGANLTVSSPAGTLISGSPWTQNGVVYYSNNACSDASALPAPNDCAGASNICSNESFPGYPLGFGTQELNTSNRGCLSDNENESQWYYIYVDATGTLTFSIDPDDSGTDYDFAVWGPFTSANAAANCPPTTNPIRCSWALGGGSTGLSLGATDLSENEFGDDWVRYLDVNAGEVYIILIDNYSTNLSPFTMNWGGGAALGCVPIVLPIELNYFIGKNQETSNLIEWETLTERNNEYFQLERSIDGINWHPINTQEGAQNSTEAIKYFYRDYSFQNEINYYRLTQVDFDGKSETFDPISIDNRIQGREIVKYVNQIGQEVRSDYDGFKIIIYSDGSTEKILGK